VDGSARAPRKDAASGDMPGVGARSRRTRDLRMGLPVMAEEAMTLGKPLGVAQGSTEWEPPERKHLSRGRKRNQQGSPE